MADEGEQPSYPPRPGFDNLIGWLFEVGPGMSGGMGAAPLSHSEIKAWMDTTGESLTAWEVRTLRRLSNDYLLAAQEAEKQNCKAPFDSNEIAKRQHAEELDKKLDQFFS